MSPLIGQRFDRLHEELVLKRQRFQPLAFLSLTHNSARIVTIGVSNASLRILMSACDDHRNGSVGKALVIDVEEKRFGESRSAGA